MKLTVLAVLDIQQGDKCVLRLARHSNPDEYDFYRACDGEFAEVLAMNEEEDTLNVRMISGAWTGRVVENVDTGFLAFQEGFGRI